MTRADAMRRLILPLVFLALATSAQAQEDILLPAPIAGQFPIKVEIVSNEPLASLCIERVDVSPPIELFCLADPDFAAGSIIQLQVLIPITPGDDAEIRAGVTDPTGNRSASPPNPPFFIHTDPTVPQLPHPSSLNPPAPSVNARLGCAQAGDGFGVAHGLNLTLTSANREKTPLHQPSRLQTAATFEPE